MIDFLQQLIRIKSLSPRDEGCFDLIEKELKELNFKCERINYQNVENLYATIGDSRISYRCIQIFYVLIINSFAFKIQFL